MPLTSSEHDFPYRSPAAMASNGHRVGEGGLLKASSSGGGGGDAHGLPTHWNDYRPLRVIGQGGFGVVYLCQRRHPTQHAEKRDALVAIKAIPTANLSDDEVLLAMNEASLLKQLEHRNLLRYVECFMDQKEEQLCLVTEYVAGGDLAALMRLHTDGQVAATHRTAAPLGGLGGSGGGDATWEVADDDYAPLSSFDRAERPAAFGGDADTPRHASPSFSSLFREGERKRGREADSHEDIFAEKVRLRAGEFYASATDSHASSLHDGKGLDRAPSDGTWDTAGGDASFFPSTPLGASAAAAATASTGAGATAMTPDKFFPPSGADGSLPRAASAKPAAHAAAAVAAAASLEPVEGNWVESFLVIDVVRQCLDGLAYLHSLSILHRDIKPANLYLDKKTGTVKIGDLGVSKLLSPSDPFTETFVGTPFYLSPELCLGEPYSFPADVWALGVLTYELYTLHLPFSADNVLGQIHVITEGQYDRTRLTQPHAFSDARLQELKALYGDDFEKKERLMHSLVVRLVERMLTPDPLQRPSAEQLLMEVFGMPPSFMLRTGTGTGLGTTRGLSPFASRPASRSIATAAGRLAQASLQRVSRPSPQRLDEIEFDGDGADAVAEEASAGLFDGLAAPVALPERLSPEEEGASALASQLQQRVDAQMEELYAHLSPSRRRGLEAAALGGSGMASSGGVAGAASASRPWTRWQQQRSSSLAFLSVGNPIASTTSALGGGGHPESQIAAGAVVSAHAQQRTDHGGDDDDHGHHLAQQMTVKRRSTVGAAEVRDGGLVAEPRLVSGLPTSLNPLHLDSVQGGRAGADILVFRDSSALTSAAATPMSAEAAASRGREGTEGRSTVNGLVVLSPRRWPLQRVTAASVTPFLESEEDPSEKAARGNELHAVDDIDATDEEAFDRAIRSDTRGELANLMARVPWLMNAEAFSALTLHHGSDGVVMVERGVGHDANKNGGGAPPQRLLGPGDSVGNAAGPTAAGELVRFDAPLKSPPLPKGHEDGTEAADLPEEATAQGRRSFCGLPRTNSAVGSRLRPISAHRSTGAMGFVSSPSTPMHRLHDARGSPTTVMDQPLAPYPKDARASDEARGNASSASSLMASYAVLATPQDLPSLMQKAAVPPAAAEHTSTQDAAGKAGHFRSPVRGATPPDGAATPVGRCVGMAAKDLERLMRAKVLANQRRRYAQARQRQQQGQQQVAARAELRAQLNALYARTYEEALAQASARRRVPAEPSDEGVTPSPSPPPPNPLATTVRPPSSAAGATTPAVPSPGKDASNAGTGANAATAVNAIFSPHSYGILSPWTTSSTRSPPPAPLPQVQGRPSPPSPPSAWLDHTARSALAETAARQRMSHEKRATLSAASQRGAVPSSSSSRPFSASAPSTDTSLWDAWHRAGATGEDDHDPDTVLDSVAVPAALVTTAQPAPSPLPPPVTKQTEVTDDTQDMIMATRAARALARAAADAAAVEALRRAFKTGAQQPRRVQIAPPWVPPRPDTTFPELWESSSVEDNADTSAGAHSVLDSRGLPRPRPPVLEGVARWRWSAPPSSRDADSSSSEDASSASESESSAEATSTSSSSENEDQDSETSNSSSSESESESESEREEERTMTPSSVRAAATTEKKKAPSNVPHATPMGIPGVTAAPAASATTPTVTTTTTTITAATTTTDGETSTTRTSVTSSSETSGEESSSTEEASTSSGSEEEEETDDDDDDDDDEDTSYMYYALVEPGTRRRYFEYNIPVTVEVVSALPAAAVPLTAGALTQHVAGHDTDTARATAESDASSPASSRKHVSTGRAAKHSPAHIPQRRASGTAASTGSTSPRGDVASPPRSPPLKSASRNAGNANGTPSSLGDAESAEPTTTSRQPSPATQTAAQRRTSLEPKEKQMDSGPLRIEGAGMGVAKPAPVTPPPREAKATPAAPAPGRTQKNKDKPPVPTAAPAAPSVPPPPPPPPPVLTYEGREIPFTIALRPLHKRTRLSGVLWRLQKALKQRGLEGLLTAPPPAPATGAKGGGGSNGAAPGAEAGAPVCVGVMARRVKLASLPLYYCSSARPTASSSPSKSPPPSASPRHSAVAAPKADAPAQTHPPPGDAGAVPLRNDAAWSMVFYSWQAQGALQQPFLRLYLVAARELLTTAEEAAEGS